jgi:hypothetical protein
MGDAAIVFGLTNPCEFPIGDLVRADEYAAGLRQTLAAGGSTSGAP